MTREPIFKPYLSEWLMQRFFDGSLAAACIIVAALGFGVITGLN